LKYENEHIRRPQFNIAINKIKCNYYDTRTIHFLRSLSMAMLIKSFLKRLICTGGPILIAIIVCSCFHSAGQKEIKYKKYVGPNRVLVLLLPTIKGKGFHYEKHGFGEAVRERGFEADLKILDINPILYLQGRIVDVVKKEIIDPAIASGYEKILLVGISLGGHGALLYVTKAPQNIDGVVIIAPFLGGFFINDVIKSAGGLSRWEECPPFEWDYACNMWKLIKDYLSMPRNQNKIILGYGLEDDFAESNQLLASQLPASNVFQVSGGHDWITWKNIWSKVLDYYRVACSERGSTSCHIEVMNVNQDR